MFKIILAASFLLAAAGAKEDFENFIDYGRGDSHFRVSYLIFTELITVNMFINYH